MLQMLRSFICNAGVFYTNLEELEADKQMHKTIKKIKSQLRSLILIRCWAAWSLSWHGTLHPSYGLASA